MRRRLAQAVAATVLIAATLGPRVDAAAKSGRVFVPSNEVAKQEVPQVSPLPDLEEPNAAVLAVQIVPTPPPAPAVVTAAPPGPDVVAAPTPPPTGLSDTQLYRLRMCESTDNYGAHYVYGTRYESRARGGYQFEQPTWDSVAARHAPHLIGTDPANATPTDQDDMARWLYSERGRQPWPVCGARL